MSVGGVLFTEHSLSSPRPLAPYVQNCIWSLLQIIWHEPLSHGICCGVVYVGLVFKRVFKGQYTVNQPLLDCDTCVFLCVCVRVPMWHRCCLCAVKDWRCILCLCADGFLVPLTGNPLCASPSPPPPLTQPSLPALHPCTSCWQHMREAAERRQQLELEHEQALAVLNAKQQEIEVLQKVRELRRHS